MKGHKILIIIISSIIGFGLKTHAQQNPKELIGDTILFTPLKGEYDCFYKTDVISSLKFNKSNKFEPQGSHTSIQAVTNCWVVVNSTITYPKGEMVVLRRIQDGQSFVMNLPIIKKIPEKSVLKNHVITNRVTYYENGCLYGKDEYKLGILCEKKSEYTNLITTITEPPVKPIRKFFDEFSSYQFIDYKLDEDSIKVHLLCNGNTDIYITKKELIDLYWEKTEYDKRVSGLNKHLSTFDFTLIDSINSLWKNKVFWVNQNIFTTKNNPLPSFHFLWAGARIDHNGYTRIEGGENPPAPSCYEWPIKGARRFSQGQIGGASWEYFKGKFVDIVCLPPYHDWISRKKIIDEFGEFVPYIRIVPDSATVYEAGPNYGEKYLGAEIKDTLFIPYTIKKMNCFLSDTQLEAFATALHKSEQEAWNEHMGKYVNLNKTLAQIYGQATADIITRGEVRFGFTTEMCNIAYEGEPYRITPYVETPLGLAESRNFYTKGMELYFIDDELIGIRWKDGKVKFK